MSSIALGTEKAVIFISDAHEKLKILKNNRDTIDKLERYLYYIG